jgi:PAS domain S-box-containing protein
MGRGAARLYGYTEDDVKNRSASSLLPEDHRGELTAMLQQIRSGERLKEPQFVARPLPRRRAVKNPRNLRRFP